MNAQDVILGTRAVHVRELQAEVSRLKADNAALRDELSALRAHLDLALLVTADLEDGGSLEIWDGWNLILGAQKVARDRAALLAQAEATGRRVWIVFDGPDEKVRLNGKVRVSYTGGSGAHRADKFICDYLRMARYRGFADRVTVRTNDRDFAKAVARIKA